MIDATAERPSPFQPARLGPIHLRNRILKAATFEGVMPRGAVSQELIDFHVAVARGGAAMTTVAYCSVSKGGRVNRDTLVFEEGLTDDLTRLTDAVHAEGAAVSAQLGHAGLVARGALEAAPEPGPVDPVQRLGDGAGQAGHPVPARRGRGRLRAGHPGRHLGRLRRHRGAPRPQLPAQLVPEPQPEQAQRRARRQHREPGPVPPAGGGSGAAGRRRQGGGARQVQHGRRRRRAGSGSRRACRSRGSSRPTDTSTPSSSPAAARWPTACTSSGAMSR